MKNDNLFLRAIKFHKTVNAMEASSEKAPYLGTVEANGTVDTDAFVTAMIEDEGCTESAESILRVINCSDAAVMTCVGEQLMKVYTGDGSLVSPFIYGSFDAPDETVGPTQSVEPQVLLGAELRDAVADIIPEEDRSIIANLGGVRIYSVLTDDMGFGMIVGVLPFVIAGMGFKPDATATAAVSLKNRKTGVVTAATVIAVDSTQRIKAKMATALTAGNYTLTVTVTTGGGTDVQTRSATKNVVVLADDTPADPTFTGCDPATQVELSESGTFAILGTNLPTLDAATLAASNLKFTADTVMSQGSKYMRLLNAADEVDLAQCTASKIVVRMGGLFNDIDGGELVGGGEPVAGKLSATLEGKAVEVAYTLVRPAH